MALPVAVTAAIAGMGIMSLMGSIFPPLGRFSQQSQNKYWTNEILDPYVLADMKAKHLIDDDSFYAQMKKHGLDDSKSNHLVEANKQYLAIYDYITLFRRGEITEQALYVFLRLNRLNDDTIENLLKVTEYFPTPPDLIRFAVREVYTTETRKKFGMDDELPDEFLSEAAKAGLPESQARNYWAAHWDLPSANMGFEMLHRRIIDSETMRMLLRALDYMPYWQEKLVELSYSPLTRVDVRRMYGLGVLSEEQVSLAYQDLGYSPENADLLTQFTIKYENNDADGLTRASIITAFKRNLINSTELLDYLKELGYSDDVANFWIEMASYEAWMDDLEETRDYMIRAFKIGKTTKQDVERDLYSLNAPTSFVVKTMDKLDTIDSSGRKVLSRTDLEKAFTNRAITGETFAERILRLGYDNEDFRIIMALNGVPEAIYTKFI